jgi:thioredoxin reductase (NADPH)
MIYDIGIIGAGPVGLFVPFIAGIKKLSCITFESLDFIGGQCSALYPEKPIYDIPAFPYITAQDLISNLEEQSKKFAPKINLSESITHFEKEGDIFVLHTSKNNQFKVKSIILATGGGKFTPNRPPLKGIEEFENKSVFYSVTNKSLFTNKNIAIAGGGDSAVDWALSLSCIAKKIYFIHRRDKFKASPESISMLEELSRDGIVEFVIPFQLKSLKGENGMLQKLLVSSLSGEEKTLNVDTLLPFFGLMTDSSLVDVFGLEKHNGYVAVNKTNMQTSVKGIYAVGDIASYEGKLKLILSGFSEVASAVYDIKKLLYPDLIERFEYSTSIFAK